MTSSINTTDSCRLINLTELKIVSLSGNQFSQLPSVVYDLMQLIELDLSQNSKLESIDKNLLHLNNLKDLPTTRCTSLKDPPYAVCKQGLTAIRRYFHDLIAEQGIKLPVIPLAIIGNLMAGKTSIAKSLKAGKRYLTTRQESSVFDEATEVFEVEHLMLQDCRVALLDYAGHEIYHSFQLLLIKELCLVLVVVNMKEFADLSFLRGPKEATRKTCFDWMSHIYLIGPELKSPILALTHVDELPTDQHQTHKESLLEMCNMIRDELLEEEKECGDPMSPKLSRILHLMDPCHEIFNRDEIVEFSDDMEESSNLKKLKAVFARRCSELDIVIPRSWERVSEFVESQMDKPYVSHSDIAKAFPNEDVLVILRYLHNSGKVLWFENEEGLSPYIFHRISAMTDMITLLFHHSSDEHWIQRMDKFTSFCHGGQKIGRHKYIRLVEQFRESGQLAESILSHLLKKDSEFPPDVALQLLQSFHIIHGPIKREQTNYYIVPYFAPSFIGSSWCTDGELQLRIEIVLEGLFPPKYVHQLMTVAVLNRTSSLYNKVLVRKNGASIYHGASTTHLVHDYNNRKITLQVSTDADDLASSWEHLLANVHCVLQLLFSVWKACQVELITYCSHCLYLRDPTPAHDVDPDWALPLLQTKRMEYRDVLCEVIFSSGVQPVSCSQHTVHHNQQQPTVPKPLQFPCKY